MSKRHTIRQGECVASVASAHGLFRDTVWDHEDNAGLRALRGDLYLLLPGDELALPEVRVKEDVVETGQRHTFQRRGVPEKLSVQLVDDEDRPYADRTYVLEVAGRLIEGRTDGDGVVDEWIPPAAEGAVITFAPIEGEGEPMVVELALGALDPAETGEGVGDRLRNLGFAGEEGTPVEDVVAAFQRARGQTVTGNANDELVEALEREHGS